MKSLYRFLALVLLLMLAGCATAPGSSEAPKFNANAQAVT